VSARSTEGMGESDLPRTVKVGDEDGGLHRRFGETCAHNGTWRTGSRYHDAGLYREFWGGQDGVTTAMNSGGWEVKRRNRVEKISNRKNLNHFFPFIWPRDPLQRVEGYLVSAWPKTATMADIRPGI